MAERVVHALEVVEVQEEHGELPSITSDLGVRLLEPVVEERTVRKPGQCVVECLVRELGGERTLIGDVALGDDVVKNVAVFVTRR